MSEESEDRKALEAFIEIELKKPISMDWVKGLFPGRVMEHKCLSEDNIRTIVREELSSLIDEMRKAVSVPEYLDAEKMSDALIAIVKTVSEETADEKVRSHEDGSHDGGFQY